MLTYDPLPSHATWHSDGYSSHVLTEDDYKCHLHDAQLRARNNTREASSIKGKTLQEGSNRQEDNAVNARADWTEIRLTRYKKPMA